MLLGVLQGSCGRQDVDGAARAEVLLKCCRRVEARKMSEQLLHM